MYTVCLSLTSPRSRELWPGTLDKGTSQALLKESAAIEIEWKKVERIYLKEAGLRKELTLYETILVLQEALIIKNMVCPCWDLGWVEGHQ